MQPEKLWGAFANFGQWDVEPIFKEKFQSVCIRLEDTPHNRLKGGEWKMDAKQYEKYVKEKTPTHNLFLNMLGAFVSGGMICTLGQLILNICKNIGLDKEISGSWTSLILVLISVLLTGFNIYPKLAKWGGAGTLVPITGFANSVAAPAIEYQKEGQVFGIGCKIFTIAGPVILYGILTSSLLGLIYYFLHIWGIV